jgi:Domain of unknown function (DUF4392)
MSDIEDIILAHDTKGIGVLRPHLPAHYCDVAARAITTAGRGTALIITGFYILNAGAPETDGPPGAVALGRALQHCGYAVVHVTDEVTAPLMRGLLQGKNEVLAFPIADDATSRVRAAEVIHRHRPELLVATERCGLTRDGTYLNMRGKDVSAHTARLDHLFRGHPLSVGVGDGGNEIGMGNLADLIPRYPGLTQNPCVTRTTHLVIASVANWGCYGLTTALSRVTGQKLLIPVAEEQRLVERCVELGAVDGTNGKREATVDGHSLETNASILEALHRVLSRRDFS